MVPGHRRVRGQVEDNSEAVEAEDRGKQSKGPHDGGFRYRIRRTLRRLRLQLRILPL